MQQSDVNQKSENQIFFEGTYCNQNNLNLKSLQSSQMSLQKTQHETLQSIFCCDKKQNNIQNSQQTFAKINNYIAQDSLEIDYKGSKFPNVLKQSKKIQKNKKRQHKKKNSQLQFFQICRDDLDTDQEFIQENDTQIESDKQTEQKSFVFINELELENILKQQLQNKPEKNSPQNLAKKKKNTKQSEHKKKIINVHIVTKNSAKNLYSKNTYSRVTKLKAKNSKTKSTRRKTESQQNNSKNFIRTWTNQINNNYNLQMQKTGRLLNESKMVYRNLGKSGLKVSVLGFGNWVTGHNKEVLETQKQIMHKAWEAGVNFFDTAEVYGAGQAEKIFGEVLKTLNADRQDLVVTTKLFWGNLKTVNQVGNSRKHLLEGIKQSLNNLQLEYVDVVFSHRPDFETPLKEVCKGFNDIIEKGYAHYWGTSEWLPEMIVRAIEICDKYGWHCPIAEQCQYSMLHRDGVEKKYAYVFDEYRYGTTIWSPLCFGILTGKYNEGVPEDSRFGKDESMKKKIYGKYLEGDSKNNTLEKLKKLAEIAKEKNVTMAQLALAWCIANEDVTVTLMGATKVSQIEDNLKSLQLAQKWDEELEKRVGEILSNAPESEMNFRTWEAQSQRRSLTWRKLQVIIFNQMVELQNWLLF